MLTPEQHEKRKKGIGGSDVAVIFGLSNYKTPYALYLEKLGLIEPDLMITEQQEWGHLLEPVIRNRFATLHNVTIEQLDIIEHPIFPFLLGNLDGYIVEWDAVHECKCSDKFMKNMWGDDGSDYIPLTYLLQVAHYCMVKNCMKAYISVLIGGNEYREFVYNRDYELENDILNACIGFWDAVKQQTPPEPVNIDDLRLRYGKPESITSAIEADSKALEYIDRLREAKEQLKHLQQLENDYKFKIMKYMENAECLTDEFGKPVATWKMNKKGSRTFLIKGG